MGNSVIGNTGPISVSAGKSLPKLTALLLALLLLPGLLPAPALAQEAQEDIELVLNEDGTLLVRGVIQAVLDNFNARGSGNLLVKAQPSTVDGAEGFTLQVKGMGEFTPNNPLNLSRVEFKLQGEGDIKNANAEIYVYLDNVDVGGNAISGEIRITASTQQVDSPPSTVRATVEATIDLSLPMDAETAAQINSMLGMVNAGLMNLQLSQMGMTFLKFEELDLTGLKATEGKITGSVRMSMTINYDDYVTWYQATLYEQQVDPQEIEKLGAELRDTIARILGEKAYAKYLVEVVVEPNRVYYNVDINAQATREFLNAYLKYLELTSKTTPTQPMGTPMAPIEVPLQPQQAIAPIQANITLAEKPLDMLVEIQADGAKGTLKVTINELYLRTPEGGEGYASALEVLKQLSTEGNDTIENIVIRLDKPAPNVALQPQPPLDKYIVDQAPDKLVLRNLPPNLIGNIALKGQGTGEARATITSPPAAEPATPTQTETPQKETTTQPATESPSPTPQQTETTPTPTRTPSPTETSPASPTEQETQSPTQAGQEEAPQQEEGGQPSLLGGSNLVLAAVGLVVLVGIALLLKK